jgi:hypothetical protein
MLPTGNQARILVRWQGKNIVAFSDVFTGLSRWLWVHWAFATMTRNKGFQKLSRPF